MRLSAGKWFLFTVTGVTIHRLLLVQFLYCPNKNAIPVLDFSGRVILTTAYFRAIVMYPE
jgi:hypothetical protein